MAVTRMPPGWTFERYQGQVEVAGPPALDVYHQNNPADEAMATLSLDEFYRPEGKDLVVESDGDEAAAVLVVQALHEAIEWIQEDGKPLASAHPGDNPGWSEEEGEMWDWVHKQALVLVKEYRTKWPA